MINDEKYYKRIDLGNGLIYWFCLAKKDEQTWVISHDFHLHTDHRSKVYFSHVVSTEDDENMNGLIRVHLFTVGTETDTPLNLSVKDQIIGYIKQLP